MNRRSWLSWLGVSAAGSLAYLPAVAESQPNKRTSVSQPNKRTSASQPGKRTWVVSLESFHVRQADQMPRLHSYLGGDFLSFFSQIHRGPKMFLEAIVAPHTPQAVFLAAFPGFDEMIETRRQLAAHPGLQRARADLESGKVPVVEQAQSQILITTDDALRFDTASAGRASSLFELRSYHAPAWRDRPPATVDAAFRRAGIHAIVNASTAPGEHLPRFTYLIRFPSLAARQEAWARLDMDHDWITLQRESVGMYGSEAKVTSASIYSLTSYSPLA